MLDTHIYLSEEITNQIQTNIAEYGETFEQFIQKALEHELQRRKANDIKSFFTNLHPLESFANLNAIAYVDNIRNNSRLVNE